MASPLPWARERGPFIFRGLSLGSEEHISAMKSWNQSDFVGGPLKLTGSPMFTLHLGLLLEKILGPPLLLNLFRILICWNYNNQRLKPSLRATARSGFPILLRPIPLRLFHFHYCCDPALNAYSKSFSGGRNNCTMREEKPTVQTDVQTYMYLNRRLQAPTTTLLSAWRLLQPKKGCWLFVMRQSQQIIF